MINIFKSSSSILFLFLNGKLEDVLTPYRIIIDFEQQTITVKKRNWHLIGSKIDIYAFRFIRHIQIEEHIFGADIQISIMGGSANVACLTKRNAEEIKRLLMLYNQERKGGFIIS